MQPLKNQFPALHWEHELGLAFTKNRMNYTNKFLVIPESGDYFVYSQVTFRGTTSECGEISQGRRPNKPDSIIVVITKVTDSYPEPTQLLMGLLLVGSYAFCHSPHPLTRLSDITFTFHVHALEKEMATHSSVLAWRIPGTPNSLRIEVPVLILMS